VSGAFSILTETDPTRIGYFFYHYRNNVYFRRKYYKSFAKTILFTAKSITEAIRALTKKEYPLLRAKSIPRLSGFHPHPLYVVCKVDAG
jgi:hypothetical protein